MANNTITTPTRARSPRWPTILVGLTACYYLLSAMTLPFANKVWLGEIPLLGLIQLPKSVLKSVVQDILLAALNGVNASSGSYSMDYITTHGWAMLNMVAVPPVMLIAVLTCLQRLPSRRWLVILMLAGAFIDAAVTLWIDNVSNLKLYNASYF